MIIIHPHIYNTSYNTVLKTAQLNWHLHSLPTKAHTLSETGALQRPHSQMTIAFQTSVNVNKLQT